ncbi:MAG TPA: DUF3606 domain-containing protein, partial [Burkholderiaceae bacterium]
MTGSAAAGVADTGLPPSLENVMTDPDTRAPASDAARIDVADDARVRHWATKLDATPEQIREAVAEVGDLAADVEMHLKGSHATTNADQQARAATGDRPR